MKRALVVPIVLAGLMFGGCEPPAHADEVAVDYAAGHSKALCTTLSEFPTLIGLQGLLEAVVDAGLTDVQAGEAVGTAVITACPRFEYLLDRFRRLHLGEEVITA